jgi:hypothetical protein
MNTFALIRVINRSKESRRNTDPYQTSTQSHSTAHHSSEPNQQALSRRSAQALHTKHLLQPAHEIIDGLILSSLVFALVLSKCGDKVSVRVHNASVYDICGKQKMGLVWGRLFLAFAH